MDRREFIVALGVAAGALALTGCLRPPCHPAPRLGFQLASLHDYIAGKTDADGAHTSGVGLAKAFRALKAMGYEGVEFDDNYLNDAKTLKALLADSGLVACGRKVTKHMLAPERIAETCEFEINYGNNLLVCEDPEVLSDSSFCRMAARDAAKCGCHLVLRGSAVADRSPTIRVRPADVEDLSERLAEVEENGAAWIIVATGPCADLSAAFSARELLRAKGF